MRRKLFYLSVAVLAFGIIGLLACERVETKIDSAKLDEKELSVATDTKDVDACTTMEFHYLITQDYMASPTLRNINVFLDKKAFSEDNLEKLFAYLSGKDSKNKLLTIVVQTDWEQLSLPSDCPPSGLSNQPAKPDKYDYHQAIFYRKGENEYFKYNPTLKTSEVKYVQMKGTKIMRNGKLVKANQSK